MPNASASVKAQASARDDGAVRDVGADHDRTRCDPSARPGTEHEHRRADRKRERARCDDEHDVDQHRQPPGLVARLG
jgi:hypothetical protein